ncbi:carboxymuconolactone decarboxylase family protein [Sorangium sp. So ce429]
MKPFELYTDPEKAPEKAKPILTQLQKTFTFVPNLTAIMAEAPVTLEGFMTLTKLFGESSFNLTEREVVLMTIIFQNECDYCMAGHTAVAKKIQMPEALLAALRNGTKLPDDRLQVLSDFTRSVMDTKGYVPQDLQEKFIAAGFTRANALEVMLAIGMQTISNYTNHLVGADLDRTLESFRWTKPGAKPQH